MIRWFLSLCAKEEGAEVDYGRILDDIDVLTNSGSEMMGDFFEPPNERNPGKLSLEERSRMMRLFQHFDRDENNFISEREIRIGLSALGNPPSIQEAKRIVQQLDLSHGHGRDGFIDFEEFLTGILHRRCLLFQALYCQHKLTGKPTSANEIAPNAERLGINRAATEQQHDPRARLKELIAKQSKTINPKVDKKNASRTSFFMTRKLSLLSTSSTPPSSSHAASIHASSRSHSRPRFNPLV